MNPRCAIGMYSVITGLVSAVRSRCGSKSTSRFSVQLSFKPQTAKAVNECFQLRRHITKTRRGAKYDSIGPLGVGMSRGSVLGEHPFAALLPPGHFGHNRWRNNVVHAAEPDFG